MISQSTKKIICRISQHGTVTLYSNLKLLCEMNDLNYHSYKNKKFPFEFKEPITDSSVLFITFTVQRAQIWYNKKAK